jgi:hypothetical protein
VSLLRGSALTVFGALPVLLIVTLALACVALPAGAQAYEVETRGAVRSEVLANTDERNIVFDGRVDAEAEAGAVTFGVTYRVYDFGDGGYNPAGIEPFYDVKHRYLEIRTGSLYARAGDFFTTFGRGLTLRSFEDIDLEHDTALDGFLAEYEIGSLGLTALAGRMREDISNLGYREHRIRCGNVRLSPSGWLTLGMTGLRRDNRNHDSEGALTHSEAYVSDDVFGGEIALWVGPLQAAGEYAYREGGNYLTGESDAEGRATYITASISTSRLTVFGEYKDYDLFEHALGSPPVCVKEYVWTLMNRVTPEYDFTDERGFLVEGILMASENFHLTGGASEGRTQGGSLKHWEIFSQLEQVSPRRGLRSIAGSWSRVYDYEGGAFSESMGGAVELQVEPAPGRPVELVFEIQTVDESLLEAYWNYLGSLTFYAGPNLTLSALAELTSQEPVDRDSWILAEIRMTLPDDLEVALGGGSERGDKKCSGGICYTEPEFEGLRLRFSKFF